MSDSRHLSGPRIDPARVRGDMTVDELVAGTFALGIALLSTVKNYTKDLFGLLLGDVLAALFQAPPSIALRCVIAAAGAGCGRGLGSGL